MGRVVQQNNLGLFDTPPNRNEIRLGIAIVALLFASVLIILPFRDIPVVESGAFVPTIDAAMFVGELMIAALLYAQASVFGSRALTMLASGYVFSALLLVPHALTFPGAFAANGLLGAGTNTTASVAVLRLLAFPIAVLLYATLKSRDFAAKPGAERPAPRVFAGAVGALALGGLATAFAIAGHDWLPRFFVNQREGMHANLMIMNVTTIGFTIAAMVTLSRRYRSVLDMWLLVALASWLFQSLLNLPLHSRFTLGWYALFGMMMASNLIVMLALIAESNRLYARLALSTAAMERERNARLTSMDAVAAAIAHEVGQPLAAVAANAAAGARWLDRPRPNAKKALETLREINDSATRSFNIIENIRAIFAKGPDWAIEFSLNDLVRETAGLLNRELAGAKISLQLSLDDQLPPVLANRVQIQQVLTNLLTNAIQSLVSTSGRRRRIAIRSVSVDPDKILLEVRDTGVGLTPQEVAHVFDAFHTTKSTGTGIGLSLCRTIVEEHGGRIWASPGEKLGATFHVQLPRSRFSKAVVAAVSADAQAEAGGGQPARRGPRGARLSREVGKVHRRSVAVRQ